MGRSPCCEKAHTNKGAWTKEEDLRLVSYINAHGEGCWRSLPKAAGLLHLPYCHLISSPLPSFFPDIVVFRPSTVRQERIPRFRVRRWSVIARRLPGRTDNEIKNYWNTHIRRKLLGRGLDPQTHRPIGGDSQSTASCEQHACSGVTMDQGRRRCPDLNLHLDLTMSVPYASPRSSTSSEVLTAPAEAEAEATTPASVLPHARTICFCYHLGFRSSQVCSCQTSSTAPVLGRREPNHSSRASSSARHQSC
ncbi:hypothetical protein GW17_00050434 [Ensete ventricosum]|nr:hypothetical protein GW17_00050434 [Ensete ventricosum]